MRQPIPSLSHEVRTIWKPLAVYCDEENCQYMMVQVIQRQTSGEYRALKNQIMSAYQINGAQVYQCWGRKFFEDFHAEKVVAPLKKERLEEVVNHGNEPLRLEKILIVPNQIRKNQPDSILVEHETDLGKRKQ